MDIIDLSWNVSKRNNNKLLPKSIRGIIVGKSGCGKTTLLLNLVLRKGWLDYNNLQVFRKSLFQPEYKILKSSFEKKLPKEVILKLFNVQDEIDKLNASSVPDPEDLDASKNNLMIFDDLQLTKQNKCENYYIRGRHSNVDCFYLAQNYFLLPRQTIRENTNFICLFPQDDKNVDHIYRDHVSSDMKKEEFKKFCKHCWSQPHGFAAIDLSSKKDYGKYRSGFDDFYIPDS